jgi:iron complex transport system substrate-binding protein
MKNFYSWFLILQFFLCCNDRKQITSKENKIVSKKNIPMHYAEGFKIYKDSTYTWIEITQPYPGATKGFQYLLVPKGLAVPEHDVNVRVIRTPVSSIVCTSTTHIPLLDYLGESEKLVGFPTTDYISSPKTRKLVDEGKVVDLGVDKGLNMERLAVLRPELLMGYTMNSDYGQFKKIEELGVTVVLNAEYLEKHPLGRAEWIKFVAALFQKDQIADSIFKAVEGNYNVTKNLISSIDSKPTVLTGIMYGDAWFLPGGKNYAATLLDDAGYYYLWKADPSHGFLELGFETVYAKAHNADYWIGIGPFQSLQELASSDNRYATFKAFKEKKVYSYDARRGAAGGNEYLELGYLRPDIILNDLVKISHPELLSKHELYFHRRLK